VLCKVIGASETEEMVRAQNRRLRQQVRDGWFVPGFFLKSMRVECFWEVVQGKPGREERYVSGLCLISMDAL
jgi:hypothetical protein